MGVVVYDVLVVVVFISFFNSFVSSRCISRPKVAFW